MTEFQLGKMNFLVTPENAHPFLRSLLLSRNSARRVRDSQPKLVTGKRWENMVEVA